MSKIVANSSWLPANIEITTAIGAKLTLDRVTSLELEYLEDGRTRLVATT